MGEGSAAACLLGALDSFRVEISGPRRPIAPATEPTGPLASLEPVSVEPVSPGQSSPDFSNCTAGRGRARCQSTAAEGQDCLPASIASIGRPEVLVFQWKPPACWFSSYDIVMASAGKISRHKQDAVPRLATGAAVCARPLHGFSPAGSQRPRPIGRLQARRADWPGS